jgi:NAD dependent epimerase/dehydratase family enzyme
MAWIHRSDWIELIRWILPSATDGTFNAVAPDPVTNAEFARTLGAALRRPAVLSVPAAALRLVMGEMAEPLLLASQRAVPTRALGMGFSFRYSTLAAALAAIVGPST